MYDHITSNARKNRRLEYGTYRRVSFHIDENIAHITPRSGSAAVRRLSLICTNMRTLRAPEGAEPISAVKKTVWFYKS